MDPGLDRGMPEHRQSGIQNAVLDGLMKLLPGEEAPADGGGLGQYLGFVSSQQGQQNGRLAPFRLPGAALQQA